MGNLGLKSLGVKIISVFWEPSKTFNMIKKDVSWIDILVPSLIVILLSCSIMSIVTPIALNDTKARFEKSEKFSQEQKEKMIENIEAKKDSITQYIMVPVSVVVKLAFLSIIMIFIGNVLLGGETKFVQMFALSAYVELIGIIASLVKVPLIVSQNTTKVYTGAGLLFNDNGEFLFNFMAQLDIFALWRVILFSIGLAIFNNTNTKKTIWIILPLWLVACAIGALIQGLVKI